MRLLLEQQLPGKPYNLCSLYIVCRMMWAAGVLASVSSITYPAISAFVSMHSDADKQGNQMPTPAQHILTCIVTNFVYKMLYCDYQNVAFAIHDAYGL